MTKTLLPLALIAAAGVGFAMTAATEIDTDGDGFLTLSEMQAVYPTLTTEVFETIDVNSDGLLDMDEVAAAEAAELLPATES